MEELGTTDADAIPFAHERFSIDWKSNDYVRPVLAERAKRLEMIRGNDPLQAALFQFYSTRPARFIDDWLMTYDPRRKPAYWPFVLFPRQIEFVNWIQDRYLSSMVSLDELGDGVADKSRDVGFSWIFCAWSVWAWRFHSGMKIGIGSYRENKVDRKDDPDSLLEKMRMLIRLTPKEFLPPGWSERIHSPFMKIINPWNGATITGEVGDQIGRGGRSTVYFVDEGAFLDHPERADRGLSANSDCKIWASTANGMGNRFAQKRHSGVFPVFTFHWKDDPRKDQKWYEAQKRKMDPVDLAMEVDINYQASTDNLFIEPTWVESAKEISWLVPFPEYGGGVSGLDVGGTGSGKSVHTTRFGPIVQMPTTWDEGDGIKTAYRAASLTKEQGARLLNFDSVGIGDTVTWTLRHIEDDEADDIVARGFMENGQANVLSSGEIYSRQLNQQVESDPLLVALREAGHQVPSVTEGQLTQGLREEIQSVRQDGSSSRKIGEAMDRIIPSNPVNVGLPAPDDVIWGDGRTSHEKFANLKAHLWFTMRERLRNTHEHALWVKGDHENGREHSLSNLLALPDCPELCSQLSLPKMERTSSGKIACESKKSLSKRGIKSPDFAESLSLTYAPEPPVIGEARLEGTY